MKIYQKMLARTLSLFVCFSIVAAQRPFFAGSKPIGFPELIDKTTEGLGNRFGEENGTTQRLPIEANGDRELVERLSKLPIDKQPFWFINWKAYEEHRRNPQTYPQKPNVFIETEQNLNNPNANKKSLDTAPNTNFPSNTEASGLANRNNGASDSDAPQSTFNPASSTKFASINTSQKPSLLNRNGVANKGTAPVMYTESSKISQTNTASSMKKAQKKPHVDEKADSSSLEDDYDFEK